MFENGLPLLFGSPAFGAALTGEPFRKRPARRVLDYVLADQLSDYLRGRQILRGANLLEDPLLSRVDQYG